MKSRYLLVIMLLHLRSEQLPGNRCLLKFTTVTLNLMCG